MGIEYTYTQCFTPDAYAFAPTTIYREIRHKVDSHIFMPVLKYLTMAGMLETAGKQLTLMSNQKFPIFYNLTCEWYIIMYVYLSKTSVIR